MCAAVGAQLALVVLCDGPDGSFQISQYFESEVALLSSAVLGLEGSANDANRLYVTRKTEENWLQSGIRMRCLVEPGIPARLIERFASERELIHAAYAEVPNLESYIHETFGDGHGADAHVEMERYELFKKQNDEILEMCSESALGMLQIAGAAPLFVRDGIPHYGGY